MEIFNADDGNLWCSEDEGLRCSKDEDIWVRKTGKDTESTSGSRLPRKYSRKRRNTRLTEHEGSDDNEDENNHDANKDSSSTDERSTEIKQRRYKRKAGAQSSQPSPSAANSDGGGNENDLEASRESKGTSGLVRSTEMLAWGGGGARSKSVRNTRIMKLTKYLENAKENDELDVHLMLISLDKQSTGSSKQLYLCCRPCFSVESLKEYVSRETQSQAEDIEILMKKDLSTNGLRSTLDPSTSTENKDVLQNLEGCETLAGLGANCAQDKNHLHRYFDKMPYPYPYRVFTGYRHSCQIRIQIVNRIEL
ncbi:hypothetical protein TEA_004564 [Camellia sinensis var. sinensis]|uniref:Uncharacterized protein n=1 Tax=Camellia sinensis var. sinensis TaxID=542762 RepID=A0A4S4DHF9_CAMSN|nr:hypothetical protein TEA_004564 [Camellia sinensis var. sinensis]